LIRNEINTREFVLTALRRLHQLIPTLRDAECYLTNPRSGVGGDKEREIGYCCDVILGDPIRSAASTVECSCLLDLNFIQYKKFTSCNSLVVTAERVLSFKSNCKHSLSMRTGTASCFHCFLR